MPIDTLDAAAWKLVSNLDATWNANGGKNYGWGTVATEPQTLTANAILAVYKLQQGDQSLTKDYYLVTGDVYHGIQGSPTSPASNWVSVGFYANYMKLRISSGSPETRVTSFGPNSTIEDVTISFSVGGELSGEVEEKGGKIGGSINASVGISFTASEVSFAARPATGSVEWHTSLPHVGWISPASPANPGRTSYAGYIWNPAVIFEVPQGKVPALGGQLEVDFEFNWTRGIRKRSFTPILDLVYQPVGSATPAVEGTKTVPTILETLHSLAKGPKTTGQTDTFLAALLQTGLAKAFGDSNLEQFVIAPTNATIEAYFEANPAVALAASSLANQRWLEDWIAERVISLPPKYAWQTTLSKMKQTMASNGDWYDCADGTLFVSDCYEPDVKLKAGLNDVISGAAA
ncbi:hypothetical protein [Pararhizobium antarcticum]|uniref:Uncharacterized protein n=1 Tax=Pararhizobium antarcticum TaxID=1798805 RepID=A0A657LNK1_9HYPH|nr:hypothetical protein [Pararhizobium antarcticum]OJF91426.1 hypothetical protein AX760_23445 [Pararhizobium antarcticum]OJF94900.1 hypothetical protein AX761_04605 [Rhizobium sp. 58]